MEYKYYNTQEGCMGYIGNDQYKLFASESDYKDWFEEKTKNIED